MAEIELTPTEQMASNAKRGLELRRKHKRGGTSVGVARARDISNRKNLSPETVRRMHAFFSRHEKNKAGGEDDAGYIAWLLWGGDAGKSWAARKVEQLERKDENMMSETRKAIMARLGMAAKARFDDDCGTGAGGFKPGNTCGAGTGAGGQTPARGKAPSKGAPKGKAAPERAKPVSGGNVRPKSDTLREEKRVPMNAGMTPSQESRMRKAVARQVDRWNAEMRKGGVYAIPGGYMSDTSKGMIVSPGGMKAITDAIVELKKTGPDVGKARDMIAKVAAKYVRGIDGYNKPEDRQKLMRRFLDEFDSILMDKAYHARPGAKARFEENCGTGAGGFKPGNKCGAEDGTGGGGATPEAKKRKRKPKRTPLAGPKVEKPAKIPSVQALEDIAVSTQPYYSSDWEAAEDELSGRTDPQAKALRNEMSALVKRWDELTDVITEMEWGSSRKNRSATKRKATADELNLLQQRAKRIIRDAKKTEKTAKRSTVEQAGTLVGQTIKAQDSMASYRALSDIRSAIKEARKRGGAGSGKLRKSLKAMEEEWRGLQREVEGINADYTDMKDQEPIDERQARALKQRAGQLLQKTGDWRKRAQALVGQAKARASRTGDKRLMAAAVRAQKILARRPGPRTRFGFLDRIGRAATALTARPVDTTAPGYAQQVEQAKREAVEIVKNYRFLRDKVVARQQAMDNYVKQAAAAIAKSKVAPDIRHFTDQISTAVKAQQMMLMAVKTPFGRPGAKAKMGKNRFCDVTSTPLPTKPSQRKQEFSHHEPGDRVMVTHDGQEVRGVVMRVMEDGGYIVDMGTKGSARFADSEVSAMREGEKLSAAAGDEAVSEKIRTLVAEGKPQDQAVAIALDMKRRGEL